jgi:hypothetical protein
VIDRETAADLKKMVGFRNVAVHEYQQIDGDIVASIVKHHLDDFERYYTQVHRFVFGVKGERDAFTGIKDALKDGAKIFSSPRAGWILMIVCADRTTFSFPPFCVRWGREPFYAGGSISG